LKWEYWDRIFHPFIFIYLFIYLFSHFGQILHHLVTPQKEGLKILQMFSLGEKNNMAQSRHTLRKKMLEIGEFKSIASKM